MRIREVISISMIACSISVPSLASSNRELLKNLYEAGAGPAVPEDFPIRNFEDGSPLERPANKCMVVSGGDHPYGFYIARTQRTTPSNGPLIPGKTEEKMIFGESRFFSYNLTGETETSETDLVMTNPIYRVWVDLSGVMHKVPAKLYARKSGEYVAFRIYIEHHSSIFRDEEYFGYCYPNN